MRHSNESRIGNSFWKNERGQGLAEYLILVLLIAVVSIGAARTLGSTVKKKIQLAERHIGKVSLE